MHRMFATFEPHHLLSITDPSIDTNKTYHQTFQGYQISAPNTRFFVLHKKIIKLIELKHIGDTMGVFYLLKRNEIASIPLNIESCIAASQLFKGWDEMKGEPYFFLPYFSPKAIAPTNAQLTALSLPTQLQQDEKGVIIATSSVKSKDIEALPLTKEDSLSFLFGLTVWYGKFEAKAQQLNSIKIHLPLFGQYLHLQEVVEKCITALQQEGLFFESSSNVHQGKISFQITSNDREVLQIFADWYKRIENFTQITKKDVVAQAKQALVAFIASQQLENVDQVQERLTQSIVKVLVK